VNLSLLFKIAVCVAAVQVAATIVGRYLRSCWLRRRRRRQLWRVIGEFNAEEVFLGVVRGSSVEDLRDQAGSLIVNYLWKKGAFAGGQHHSCEYRFEPITDGEET